MLNSERKDNHSNVTDQNERRLSRSWLRQINFEGMKVIGGTTRRASSTGFLYSDNMLDWLSSLSRSRHGVFIQGGQFHKYFKYIHSLVRFGVNDFALFSHVNVKFEPWLKTRLMSVRLPAMEHSMKEAIEHSFPKFRGRIPEKLRISHSDVMREDLDTIGRHCAEKNREIEWSFLKVGVFMKAIDSTAVALGFENLKLHWRKLSFTQSLECIPTDTSSGYPHFKPKGNIDMISDVEQFFNYFKGLTHERSMIRALLSNPVVVFHRFTTKLKNIPNMKEWRPAIKIRQVFGVSFRNLLIETSMMQRVLEVVQRYGSQNSIGRTRPEVSRQVQNMRRKASLDHRVIFCGDISGIDKNLTSFLVMSFFSVLLCSLPLTGYLYQVMGAIAVSHVTTPIITGFGMYITNGGNVSGSKITQIMNTFCVTLVCHYFYLFRYGRAPGEHELYVQGDDFIIIIEGEDVNLFIRVCHAFVLNVSTEKSKVVTHLYRDYVQYLGFSWDDRGLPDNQDSWWVGRTVFPERYVDDYHGFFGRTFIRFCSVIFQLKRGNDIYDTLFNRNESLKRRLIDHLRKGDPTIEFIDKRGRTKLGRIPLSRLKLEGWSCY
jgi:hypothetical protein